MGFSDEDITKPGSDALIDVVIAYGTSTQVADRVKQHIAASAGHVGIQVIESDKLLPALTTLAAALGLAPNP
jgi:hypothetical protein